MYDDHSDDRQPQVPPIGADETVAYPPAPTGAASPWRRGVHLVFALLLLTVGPPFAWLLGVGVANLIAAPGRSVPLQEVLLRRSRRIVTEVWRLPSRWQPSPAAETRLEAVPIPVEPAPPLVEPPPALSDGERQIAQEEIAALEQELQPIKRRLLDLEARLGQAQSTADVESRIAALERRLTAETAESEETTSEPSTPEPDPEANAAATAADQTSPLLEVAELRITLPSDALFVPGEARLLNSAPELLQSIFSDIARHPGATVLVGAHTDDRSDPRQSRTLSFQQAVALKAYLTGSLDGHRWVALGYGQSRPLTDNATPAERQRNRRIEIIVDSR